MSEDLIKASEVARRIGVSLVVVQRIFAVLLVALVGSVCAADAKEVVVASAKELKGIKAKTIIWKKDGAKMVLIPESELVTASAFYMDTTEVTVGQFKKFLSEADHPFDGELWGKVYEYSPTDKHPMIYVSWFDATAYAKWAGKRLPTEAEWEFAARGGLVDKIFTWGDEESIARDYANFYGTGGRDQWKNTTAPVGSLKPNGYGLYDMSGNVWEWCQDWYSEDKKYRVLRGGSWYNDADNLRAAGRNSFDFPSYALSYYGFRCVSGSK